MPRHRAEADALVPFRKAADAALLEHDLGDAAVERQRADGDDQRRQHRRRRRSAPLNAPASVPTTTPASMAASIGKPCSMQTAMADAHRPTIEPTEISISPVMMISVIGKATIATGAMPASAIEMLDEVRKYSETCAPETKVSDQDDAAGRPPSARAASRGRFMSPPPAGSRARRAAELAVRRRPARRARRAGRAAVEEDRAEDRRADHRLRARTG